MADDPPFDPDKFLEKPFDPDEFLKKAAPSYGQQAGNVARIASNALTFGQWDRARAGLQALTSDKTYADALKEEVAKSKRAGEEAGPFLRGTGEALGGMVPGIGATAATSRALGTAARPVLQRMGIGAAEGGVLGAAQGAGNVYTGQPEDYLKAGGMGATLGVGIGAAAPAAGALGAGAYRGLANRGMFGAPSGQIAQAAQADAPGLQRIATTPGAMLPDAGPSMLGVAQGAVTGTGGPGRTALVDALRARDVATGQRITGEVNRTFGPAPVPSQIQTGIEAAQAALSPQYQAAIARAKAVDTSALAKDLETQIVDTRGPAQAALRQVRTMLDVPGNPGNLDPHPGAMLSTRHAIDGMIASNPDPNVVRVLTNARQRLNTQLHQSIPDIVPVDARYAELAAQSGALTRGGQVFDTGKTAVRPSELQAEIAGMAGPAHPSAIGPSQQPLRQREGVRAELDRIVGTNKNDLLKLENLLGQPQDWNAQKLGVVFGPQRAQRLFDVLERERGFRQTYQDVVQGSQTAQRTAAKEALEAGRGKIPLETGITGLTLRGIQEGVRGMRESAAQTNRDRIAQIMATRDPAELRAIIDRLLVTQPNRERRSAIINALTRGAVTGAGTAIGRQ